MDEAWAFMKQYYHENGRPASLAEIAEAVPGLNYRSSARHRVDTLIERGLAMRIGHPGSARNVIPLEPVDHKLPWRP